MSGESSYWKNVQQSPKESELGGQSCRKNRPTGEGGTAVLWVPGGCTCWRQPGLTWAGTAVHSAAFFSVPVPLYHLLQVQSPGWEHLIVPTPPTPPACATPGAGTGMPSLSAAAIGAAGHQRSPRGDEVLDTAAGEASSPGLGSQVPRHCQRVAPWGRHEVVCLADGGVEVLILLCPTPKLLLVQVHL